MRFAHVVCLSALFVIVSTYPASAVLREWDDEGTTFNWSEAANWTDDGVPATTDDVEIGSLAEAFDDSVVLDVNADVVRSFTLTNGADFDTNGGRVVSTTDVNIGNGSASGTTTSELVIRRRNGTGNATFAIDANKMLIGDNGKVVLIDGGRFELDGTGAQDSTLTLRENGEFHGYGEIALTDSDVSLGSLTSLVINDGLMVVEDPLFAGIGEPAVTSLQITTPNAPTLAQLDFAGPSGTGIVELSRNSQLMLDAPFVAPSTLLMAANTILSMPREGLFGAGSTTEINSGISNPGEINEMPAVPAIITGEGLLSFAGVLRINMAEEELIIETPIDATEGLIANQGTLRLRGGGNIRAVSIDDLEMGVLINESASVLEFQGGQTYGTGIINDGVLGVDPFEGNATVVLDDITQGTQGTLAIDLGGELDGEFDVLSVVDDATLEGALRVSLAEMFEPAVGTTFTILEAQNGAVSGQFTTLDLPSFAGRTFDVVYNASSVQLEVIGDVAVDGDFDLDGDVDGADFLLWQQGGSPDSLSAGDLAVWQSNYAPDSPAEAAASAVPEPASLCCLLLALGLVSARRKV